MTWTAVPRGYAYPSCVVCLDCGHRRVLLGSPAVLSKHPSAYCWACETYARIVTIWQAS